MKDYINRLARGKFEYEPPVIYVSDCHIEEEIIAGEDFYGEFTISSMDGRPVKGMVYSQNPLVELSNPVFNAVSTVIRYQVNTNGLERGSTIEGKIDIVSNGGEQAVYYSFKTRENKADSSMGRIHNLFHFANLVQAEPGEAVSLFNAPEFERIFIKDDNRLKNIYSMVKSGNNVERNIEEFLISTNKKSPVVFGISATEQLFTDLKEKVKSSVVIAKGTWGYADIFVKCDNPCISLETDKITSDMFAGNKYEFSFIIDPAKCHGGKNYAVIEFDCTGQHLELMVTISPEKKSADKAANNKKAKRTYIKRELYELVSVYVDFRLKKINMITWLKKSTDAIEKIRSFDESNIAYKLLHAQILLAGKKREEAGWLIENAGARIPSKDKDSDILYAYYLYLSCLYKQDRNHSREVLDRVSRMREEGSDSWQILWVIMYLDEDFEKNKTLRLASIKEQFYNGCKSPVMYLEALQVLNEQPVLLRVFDEFELQVLNFGLKNDALSEKLLNHISELADIKKSASSFFTRFLKCAYDKTESEKLLSTICKIMLRNEEHGRDSFYWYEKAVNAGIRLTNLYEYYMYSIDRSEPKVLPKLLLMYFTYNNTLDYVLKSFLYASIIMNKYEDDQTYENYRHQMESFVIDQVIKGHINDNLVIVYREMLSSSMIKMDMAESVLNVIFTRKVTCVNGSMVKVYVKHKEYEEPECYLLSDKKAFVRIFTEDAVIVFEDREGNRFVQSVDYTLENIFDESEYIPRLRENMPDNIWLRLYVSENTTRYELTHQETIENMKQIILDENICANIRMRFISDIIYYYYSEYEGYELASEYINIDAGILSSELRKMVIETYMVNNCFEEAMAIIEKYGVEGCNPKRVLRTCIYLIDKYGYDERADILYLATYVFFKRKYNSDLLKYLVLYYNGNTRSMLELWKACDDFEVERKQLSERLLIQLMFVHSYSGSFEKIFEDYYNSGAKERLVEAYVGYNAYNYFVKDTVISNDVFRVIEHRLMQDRDVLAVAKLALLMYYSGVDMVESQKKLAQKILDEMCGKDIIFAFYRKFAGKLILPFHVRNMSVVEYVANPDTHVTIHYIQLKSANREYMVEEMQMLYEGMFVKNFVLFYGESVQYYITEEKNGIVTHTESRILTCEEMNPETAIGRYEMINDILASRALNDDATFDKMLHGYVVADSVAKEVFKPL